MKGKLSKKLNSLFGLLLLSPSFSNVLSIYQGLEHLNTNFVYNINKRSLFGRAYNENTNSPNPANSVAKLGSFDEQVLVQTIMAFQVANDTSFMHGAC